MGNNSNNNEVVVWEFRDNANFWIPYSSDVSGQIERARRKNLTVLYLRDVDPSLACYSINLTGTMHQTRHDTGTQRPIRQSNCADVSCPGQGVTWQWLGDYSSTDWCSFSVHIQQEIENAYQNHNLNVKGSDEIDLEQFAWQLPYIVNFSTMIQTRKLTHNTRPVRRTLGKPYLASLKPNGSSTSSGSNVQHTSCNTLQVQANAVGFQTPAPSRAKANGFAQPSASSSNGSSLGSKIRSWISPLLRQNSNSALPAKAKISGQQLVRKASDGFIVVENAYPKRLTTPIDIINNCSKIVQDPENEDCGICRDKLTAVSPYTDDLTVVSLRKCDHTFHHACLEAMIKNGSSDSCVQCPACKTIHGVKIGNQPPGRMKYTIMKYSLVGFKDCNTIVIEYSFSSGIQGPEHPSPGSIYNATGYPRVCYLPDNEKGNKVLRLLCVAWQRRLIFTIGTSVTTGQSDSVTWNEIHHKTEIPSNYTGHGYPDANYLDNVLLELAAHGVTEEDS